MSDSVNYIALHEIENSFFATFTLPPTSMRLTLLVTKNKRILPKTKLKIQVQEFSASYSSFIEFQGSLILINFVTCMYATGNKLSLGNNHILCIYFFKSKHIFVHQESHNINLMHIYFPYFS